MTMDQLRQTCLDCRQCNLSETRNHVVFGVGPEETPILFVGEGPGQQEDLQGEPFVGPAGKLLDDMLSIIDLSRRNCYITNIVKCRPPRNRDPLETEQQACICYLRKQTLLLKPRILVCLGRIAATRLIDEQLRITRVSKGRHLDDGPVSPLRPAAGCNQTARHVSGFEGAASQDSGGLPRFLRHHDAIIETW